MSCLYLLQLASRWNYGHFDQAMISRRKQQYSIGNSLHQYLYHFGRHSNIPLVYDDLLRFVGAISYEDPTGHETLWLTVMYPPEEQKKLCEDLISIYTALKIGGDTPLHEHLSVDRIDFGEFGNSRPFRVKITNQLGGVFDVGEQHRYLFAFAFQGATRG